VAYWLLCFVLHLVLLARPYLESALRLVWRLNNKPTSFAILAAADRWLAAAGIRFRETLCSWVSTPPPPWSYKTIPT